MNIPILFAIIALLVAWREIRRLSAENLSLYFDKLAANKRTEEANLRVLLLEKKHDKLLGEKTQLEHSDELADDLIRSLSVKIENQKAELKRKHRKVGA